MASTVRILKAEPKTEAHPFFQDGRWLWEKNYPAGLSWHTQAQKKPVFQILDNTAARFPRSLICDYQGKTFTYGQAKRLTDRIAKGLQKLGVTKGVKVGLFLPNSPYTILFHYGILKAGGTVVNYNPLYVERELAHQVEDSETDFVVTVDTPALYKKMQTVLDQTRLKKLIICPMAGLLPFPRNLLNRDGVRNFPRDGRHVLYRQLVRNNGRPAPVSIDLDNDIAVLQYTGGTTGLPKGAMLTHGCISANVDQLSYWKSPVVVPGQETIVCVIPLFHVFAMTAIMHCGVQAGMKIVIVPTFTPAATLNVVAKHRPTFFHAVPAAFNALAASREVGRCDFSSLKFCITGGAPMALDVHRLFEETTKCHALREGYGLTETSPGVTFNPAIGKVCKGTVGMPLPGTVIDIVNPETGELMAAGEKGEVCVRGPQVMKGYYNKPEETARVMKNGRLHTGDVGFIDNDGYLHLVDRIKDLIIVRGYNVYPRAVEEAIYHHPAVEECIVAGVPDDTRGETVWAWVKPHAGKTLTEAELSTFLNDRLSPIERPRRIVVRETPLPKTAVGKLSKKDLLEQEGIQRK